MHKLLTASIISFGIATGFVFLEQLLVVSPGNFIVPGQYTHPWPLVGNVVAGTLVYSIGGAIVYHARHQALPWEMIMRFSIGVFLCTLLIAIATQPTRAQDAYWNLALAHGWVAHDMSPYHTSPNMLPESVFLEPVLEWRDLPMTHGPLWVLILAAVVWIVPSLAASLVLIKIIHALAICLGVFCVYQVMKQRAWSMGERTVGTLLLLFNPLLLQMAVVDLHNDVWIFLSIASALYFFEKKQFGLSATGLLAGAFVKYITALLLPIPFIALAVAVMPIRTKVFQFGFWCVASGVLLCAYLPFGMPWELGAGLQNELTTRGSFTGSLLPTYLLTVVFSPSITTLRVLGLSVAAITLAVSLAYRKYTQAFFWPLVLLLSIGTPWFEPWYVLWLLPSAALLPAMPLLLLMTSIVYLVPEVIFSLHVAVVALIPATTLLAFWIWKRLNSHTFRKH